MSSSTPQDAAPFVDVRNLRVTFTGGRKPVEAVNGVDLQVRRGEVVALIGESGSGKSVTLRSLLRLHPPARTRNEGPMRVGAQDVLGRSARALADYRGKVASMIFQEPLLALDPVYTVGAQIVEALRRHETLSPAQAHQRALEMFERVRIPSPERRLQAYPHEMSGGMRQRAMIALALACRPQLLLADEPTTALDATVQIQILLLLRELQRELSPMTSARRSKWPTASRSCMPGASSRRGQRPPCCASRATPTPWPCCTAVPMAPSPRAAGCRPSRVRRPTSRPCPPAAPLPNAAAWRRTPVARSGPRSAGPLRATMCAACG